VRAGAEQKSMLGAVRSGGRFCLQALTRRRGLSLLE
jgi:hypothetical protein